MCTCKVSLQAICEARRIVTNVIRQTPLVTSAKGSELMGFPVYLKLENLQKTGSFKIRGAFYKLWKLARKTTTSQVMAISAGNHAQGVAFAGQLTGIQSTIFMPQTASLFKIEKTRNYGATVITEGNTFSEAHAIAMQWLEDHNDTEFISPFDDDDIITGQGTTGLEILEQLPETKTVVVPVGGGGLISGIAIAIKEQRPDIKIIGVQSAAVPSMYDSFQKKTLVYSDETETIADGIAIKRPSKRTFGVINRYVDELIVVSEEELINALFFCLQHKHLIVEGAGVAAFAAILEQKLQTKGPVVSVVSGGNIDMKIIDSIIRKGLLNAGRYLTFKTLIKDKPGNLMNVLKLLADQEGNILSVQHTRLRSNVPLGYVEIEVSLETRNDEHVQQILNALHSSEYEIRE